MAGRDPQGTQSEAHHDQRPQNGRETPWLASARGNGGGRQAQTRCPDQRQLIRSGLDTEMGIKKQGTSWPATNRPGAPAETKQGITAGTGTCGRRAKRHGGCGVEVVRLQEGMGMQFERRVSHFV